MRDARPWYSAEKKAYFASVRRRKVRLLKGDESTVNAKLAAKKLREVLRGSKNDTPASALLVAHVIDRYLRLTREKYGERAFEERRRYLQLFAFAHGWRKVNDRDCLPVHVEEWIADHPEWSSDWTKGQIVSIVMRPFNWAAKKRIIPANPFRGVEKTAGQPRRPMTDAEFQTLLRHAAVWKKRRRPAGRDAGGRKVCPSDRKKRLRPSTAGRFRQALVFLRLTGCRPGELCGLEWPDIDLEGETPRRRRSLSSLHAPLQEPTHEYDRAEETVRQRRVHHHRPRRAEQQRHVEGHDARRLKMTR